jgi:hypothetical protein
MEMCYGTPKLKMLQPVFQSDTGKQCCQQAQRLNGITLAAHEQRGRGHTCKSLELPVTPAQTSQAGHL